MATTKKRTQISSIIFDTDVLIWYFRGNKKAAALIRKYEVNNRWTTSVTVMELFQGCRNLSELNESQAFIAQNISKIIHPKTSISEKAIHLTSEYTLSHGLQVMDALIAASTLLSRATLATGNKRHFDFIPGIELLAFRP